VARRRGAGGADLPHEAGAMDIRITVEPHEGAPAPGPAPATKPQEGEGHRPASILRPRSEGVKGQDMRLQLDSVPSPAFTYRPHSSAVPQNEFKLQWPQSPADQAQHFATPRARPRTALQSRLSALGQPANRTPRAWQKLQQRDQEEADSPLPHTPRERLHHPASASRHRPGWQSARRPPSGITTPRVQSARARRPPEWKSGAEALGNTGNSGRASPAGGEPANARPPVQTSSFAQIMQEEERQVRQEMREYRDKLFENPKRRFTRREMETFCLKLLGSTDTQQMHRICAKAPDDRSYEDCTFLCKMLSKCNFVQQNMSPLMMLAVSRCIQGRSLAPGEDLLVDDKTPQIFVLVQGLMAEPDSGSMMKQGEYILRMSRSARKVGDSLMSRSLKKIAIGVTLNRRSSAAFRRRSSSTLLESSSEARSSASSSRTASPEASPRLVSCYESLSLSLSSSPPSYPLSLFFLVVFECM